VGAVAPLAGGGSVLPVAGVRTLGWSGRSAIAVELGSTGTVRTVIGLVLPFEVTRFEEGRSWSWSVAGCPATHHVVEGRGPHLSRVGFGVPWIAAPYLVVCRMALRRLDELGLREVT
jgi:hypothetical protein